MNLPNLILFGVFFCLVGACVGSFLNVVIWRLPNRGREVIFLEKRGRITLSWPPSHCPVCDAPIQWYRNIPVLSFLLLKGRCANCRTAIPIRYPLVELGTAVMFLALYLTYFVAHWQPGIVDVAKHWPPFILHLAFASALLAGSAIDADLFIIPISICVFLAIIGIAGAALIGPPLTSAFPIIPNLSFNNWILAKPIAGTFIGLLLANLLMQLKLMPRSFDQIMPPAPATPEANVDEEQALAPPPKLTRFGVATTAALLILATGAILWIFVSPKLASLLGLFGGILIFLIGVLPRDAGQLDVTDEVLDEISSPHVRREISKELLFLAVPLACGAIAYFLPIELPQREWMGRVLGSLMGLLVGGGMIWLLRVAGSLWLGREAMGMGDAHLMAGVGAVIGAPLVVIAFFMAPFFALLWGLVLKMMGKPNVLPYGPWLSVASILSLVAGNMIIGFYWSLLFIP